MKQNKLAILKIVIAFVLLAAIGMGLFFGGRWAVEKIDSWMLNESTHNDDGTTKLPDSSDPDTDGDTTTPDSTTPSLYIDEANKVGFSQVGNVTYFFKVVNFNDRILNVFAKPFGSYDVNLRYSCDGQLWTGFGYYNSDYGIYEGSISINSISGTTVYVCYTSITDCEYDQAIATLHTLSASVFNSSDLFGYQTESLPG